MTQLLPPKKEVALALLERSNVDVYLDPRAKGVVVPPQYRKEPRLILKIGLNMPVPIPDLRLDDESMSCTLSFNRSPFFCVVPWPSVFAMVGDDGRGMVWPEDVPDELAVRVVDDRQKGRDAESLLAPVPSSSSTGARGRGRVRAAPAPPAESKAEIGGDRPARKKSKKKKDEVRPALVSVPPAPPSTRDIGEAREAREAREGRGEGRKDRASPVPPAPRPVQEGSRVPTSPAAQANQRKAKRELPPYLRVVK